MADIDDDFGDLYADVEAQASSAINAVPDSFRSEAEPENPNANAGLASKLKKVDDCSARIGEEIGDRDVDDVDNGSDSEDDFNIVLNDDDDCKVWGGSRNVDEDQKQDEDFGVVAEGNGSSRNWSKGDQVGEGLEQNCNDQTGVEGRNGVKLNYNSQYKYMRCHGSLFPSTLNGSTGVAAFPSMLPRGDWEVNRYNAQQGSCSGQVARIHAKANTVVTQSGYGFWLPRYRTILDINIDTFEEKPWRYPGVNVTDFFNFGLNEDRWKQYCNSLELYRQQSSMRTRFPIYESNQVYGAGSMSEKLVQQARSENHQIGLGRIVSSSELSDGKGRPSDLPKGRAIPVEDSIGERQSSMDISCPTSWYPDVVIQINVQDSAEESPRSGSKEIGHNDYKEQEKSENRDLDVDVDSNKESNCCSSANGDNCSIESCEGNVRRLDRCIQPTTAPTIMSLDSNNHGNSHASDVDIHNHAKLDVCTPTGKAEAMEIEKNISEEAFVDTCDAYPYLLESELSFGDQDSSSPTLSSIGSDSEVSKDCIHDKPGKIVNPLARSLSDSGTDLRETVTSDYNSPRSNGIKMNPGDSKDYYSRNKMPTRREKNGSNGRIPSVAEVKTQTENGDESIPMSGTEAFLDRDYTPFACSRQKESLHFSNYYDNEDFSCYREAEDYDRTIYKKYPRRKGHQRFIDKMDPSLRKYWGDGKFPHKQKNTRLDNEGMEDDRLRDGRGFSTGDMSLFTSRGSRWGVSKHSSYTVKEGNFGWRRKTDKQQFQKKAGPGGMSRDYKNENNYMPQRYERHLQFSGRDLQNLSPSGRYRNRPSMGCSQPTEYHDEHWRLSNHQSLSSHCYEESHPDGGRWYPTRPPRNVDYDPRSTEGYGRYKRQISDEEVRENDWDVSYNDPHPDDMVHLGRGRYNCHSDVWSEDKIISRQQEDELYADDALFSDEKNSGLGNIRSKCRTLHYGMQKYRKIREGNNANFFNRSSNNRYRDEHEQTAQRCRDSVDLVVGEGKPSRRYSENKDLNKQAAATKESVGCHNVESNKKWLDKFVVREQNQDLEVEEGQIVTEEATNETQCANRVCETGIDGEIDKQRILESLAKMEKRRARFTEPPIGRNKELEGSPNPNPNANLMVNTEESKQQRPARKRRWGGI